MATLEPLAPGLHLMDCMEGMRRFPDGYFDLAIVDPPYGDGNANIGGGGHASADGSTDTRRWNRFGQRFDRYKVEPICRGDNLRPISRGGGTEKTNTTSGILSEPGEPGQANTAKKS